MSSKYSEKNVLQIKRDILKASEELKEINLKKEEALKGENGLENIQRLCAEERIIHEKKIANIWIQVGDDLKKIQEKRKVLESDVLELSGKKVILEYQISTLTDLLKDTIESILKEKNNQTFIPSLIEEAKKLLASIYNKKINEERTLEVIIQEKERLEKGLENLKELESEYNKKIVLLKEDIIIKESIISDLERRQKDLDVREEELNRREHDCRVMEARIQPEYRRMYLNRKQN